MPALNDVRRERFAQAIHSGKTDGEAHAFAGYSKGTKSTACRIHARPDVAQRIAELDAQAAHLARAALERAAKTYDVTTERIIAELAKIGLANMHDYLSVDSNGEPHFDYAKITRDQAAAIQEITIDEYKEGKGKDARPVKRVRFKLADKRAALVDLGRHLGLFVDPSVLNLNIANFFSEQPPTMDEWRREIDGSAVEVKPAGMPTGMIEQRRKIAK